MENNNKYKLNDMGERDSLDERIVTKMIRQVETLSNKYSKLLVVRIDLHVLGDAGIQIISATLMDEWREVANC